MFTKSARFYDAIYGFKDYSRETGVLLDLLATKKGGTLLDVACGTGMHLKHLAEHFKCEGLDIDPNLLSIARERLPSMPFHLGDMTSFDLGRQFDVVTCLFSSIGYVRTLEGLIQACKCFATHTKPGGILILEPWFAPEQWKPGHLHALFIDEPDLKLARMSNAGVDGAVSIVDFEYLISTKEGGIERASEHHELGLFTREQYTHGLEEAGFQVEYQEEGLMGRGLYLCRR